MIKQIKSFVASSLLTLSSSVLPVALPLLIAVPTVTMFAQPAKANKTEPFILRKGLGCGSTCEVIVVSQNTGKVYKIEYFGRIGAADGTEVMIEMNNYGDNWYKVINPVNGKSSNIYSVQIIN
ncbi:MAG: hypothetical protein F6K22_10000 [Okeania sp. SIO2F4]|uniref:hypothetical protein n=1 Tax=Okeania sp. SIO2F4 TaxID=2607790 RepID=UPI00142C8F46|nr:hypothetical protein [Okeania sp. SIO2F4]NES03155.1 hypothetical protein [Okeania sp. SIO2F4]